MTTLAPLPAIAEYTNAVRAALADLDAETVEELTGGLDADLTEALEEHVSDGGAAEPSAVAEIFGPADQYAAELRAAAGIARPEPHAEGARAALRSMCTAVRERGRALADRYPRIAAVAQTIRPAWWVLRAWVLWYVVIAWNGQAPAFSDGVLPPLVLVALIGVSVAWGRRQLGQRRPVRWLGIIASVLAVLMLPTALTLASDPVAGAGWDAGYEAGVAAARGYGEEGVLAQPTNLFVYGPDGQPIAEARILDQDGDPVVLSDPETGLPWSQWSAEEWYGSTLPAGVLEHDVPLNSYPWSYLDAEDIAMRSDGMPIATGDAEPATWPAQTLPSLLPSDEPTGDGAATQESGASAVGPDVPTEEPTEEPTDP